MHLRPAASTFIRADLGAGGLSSLRVHRGLIVAQGVRPEKGDRVLDLRGDRVLPGLINAHDHLQLNALPACDFGKIYAHAREWIADVDGRRRADLAFESAVAIPREQRLLLGGLKNLLSGVTTVAHHDPLYRGLSAPDYPTRVMTELGWSHSLYLDGPESVRRSFAQTLPHWPWIIHAAEGCDAAAHAELEQLAQLGCLGPNTLIVHGVALDSSQQERLTRAGSGLVWCPSSNLRLFGRTAEVAALVRRKSVALGTDSRLSGARDLLEELCIAQTVSGLDDRTLEELVTCDSARLLRLRDRGVLRPGARADLVIVPAGSTLPRLTRGSIRLVVLDGMPRYGDADLCRSMAPHGDWRQVRVDGRTKCLDAGLVERLTGARVREEGLDVTDESWRVA